MWVCVIVCVCLPKLCKESSLFSFLLILPMKSIIIVAHTNISSVSFRCQRPVTYSDCFLAVLVIDRFLGLTSGSVSVDEWEIMRMKSKNFHQEALQRLRGKRKHGNAIKNVREERFSPQCDALQHEKNSLWFKNICRASFRGISHQN